jgi:hypothetical protein
MHAQTGRLRFGVLLALLAGLLLAQPGTARAQRESGIQLSPESNRYFISKDVGTDRWAITYNLDDKTVTGNVFPSTGGAPTFLTCTITSVAQDPNPANAQYSLECRSAGPCASAPCSNQWSDPTPVGPIPGSFFLPTNTTATYAGNIQPIYSASCATSAICHANGSNLVVLAPNVSYGNTVNVQSNGQNGPQGLFIDPFQPDMSYLLGKVEGTAAGARMPYNGDPLPQDQIDAIRNWILEGAADN